MPYDPWPATLPALPVADGFQRAPRANVVAFQPEDGPAMTRRRSTARGKMQSMTFIVSLAQAVIFEEWFEEDLRDGSRPYLWEDPVRGDAAGWKFFPRSPYSLTPKSGDYWNLVINVERLP